MDLHLTDKVAFVAGSSRGIGRAIAGAFLAEGARAVITGRDAGSVAEATAAFQEAFAPERVLAFSGDLSDPKAIDAALAKTRQQWGAIDVLVANIGSGTATQGWNLSQTDWDDVFAVNLWPGVRLMEAGLPAMVEAGRGVVIFISSIAGRESTGAPLTYGAAKAALMHYTKSLARRVGQFGVRVNCVEPGNILFEDGSWDRKLREDPDRVQSIIESDVPLQRFGRPEEIGDLVVFLASERAAFITGACFVADGGQTRSY